jgi:hypothetical protein
MRGSGVAVVAGEIVAVTLAAAPVGSYSTAKNVKPSGFGSFTGNVIVFVAAFSVYGGFVSCASDGAGPHWGLFGAAGGHVNAPNAGWVADPSSAIEAPVPLAVSVSTKSVSGDERILKSYTVKSVLFMDWEFVKALDVKASAMMSAPSVMQLKVKEENAVVGDDVHAAGVEVKLPP